MTSFIFGYFFSSCFMNPIQAFWFGAEAAADTIAIWPAAVDLLGQQVHLAGPDLGRGRLVDEQVAAGRGVGVVGDHGDALGHRRFSVGHSAVGSVADTIRALAPLVIAAWMAGICEAGVAAVPLVSVPVSPSALSAASAPPDFTLSAVVK